MQLKNQRSMRDTTPLAQRRLKLWRHSSAKHNKESLHDGHDIKSTARGKNKV
jgi:hypothetical protein